MNLKEKSRRNIVQVGIGLTTTNGGINKSVEQFDKALGGTSVISFSTENEIISDKSNVESKMHLRISEFSMLKNFGYAKTGAVDDLAKSAELIICHVMFRYHAIWVYNLSMSYGIPYWFVPHGQLDPYVFTYKRLTKHVWMNILGKRLLNRSRYNIFSTSKEKEKAGKYLSKSNSIVIPWAVEVPDIDGFKSRKKIRVDLGILDSDKVFLYFGRLHPMKRPLETIRAISALGEAKAHLIMLGVPSVISKEECISLARELGFTANFHFIDPVFGNEKYAYLNASDVYVSLSHRENFNFSAVESMATGLPVVLSSGNDICNDLDDAKFAITVDPDNHNQLNLVLRQFCMMTKSQLKELGQESRNYVLNNYSFNKFSSSLKDLCHVSIP